MDEMIPFLRAIAANPGDDAPRLAFADWLTEHDQPERAEFIRLQIELTRTDPGGEGYAEKTVRMHRCGVLTQKGKQPFFDYLPTKKCKIAFHRGFIESIDTAGAEQIDSSGLDLAIRSGRAARRSHVLQPDDGRGAPLPRRPSEPVTRGIWTKRPMHAVGKWAIGQ